MMDVVDLTNGQFELHDKYVVVRFNEGADIGLSDAVEIKSLLQAKYTHPFGWISDKVHSYSTNPVLIKDLIEDLPLSACAQVTYGKKQKEQKLLSIAFLPKNLELHSFTDLKEAISWVVNEVGN